ncbi:hypothetical protein MRX96_013431 [Rhipicephalus microplus]
MEAAVVARTALQPKRSQTTNRGERTFDDSRREEMEVAQHSTGATSAVVRAPQPSTPVDAPTTEVRCSDTSTETKDSELTEMGRAVPLEIPSAPTGTSSVGSGYSSKAGTIDTAGTPSAPTFPLTASVYAPSAPPTFPQDSRDDPRSNALTFSLDTCDEPPSAPPTFPGDTCNETPSAPPTFPVDTCDDHCGFPMTYDRTTTQTEVSNCQVAVVAPMACGYDVLGWSRDVGRYYPEISGIFDPRTTARPRSEDQVLRQYGGVWLNGRKGMVADFVALNQEKNLNHHSLYVLLANYLRSRELLSETTSPVG